MKMKFMIALLVAAVFSNESHAGCEPQANAANSFMNAYKKHCDTVFGDQAKETTAQWVQGNTQVTGNFKRAYKKIIDDAFKQEPEIGLGADPVFDAQDYPEQGFKVFSCNEKTNLVTLQGVDWQDFRVVVKTIKTEQGWLVDGAGVVNIPKNQQRR